jgi:hypothetical protein
MFFDAPDKLLSRLQRRHKICNAAHMKASIRWYLLIEMSLFLPHNKYI